VSRPFVDVDLYPELEAIGARFDDIRGEAIAAREHMTLVTDHRTGPGDWAVLPFRVEAEDREVIPDDLCATNRRLAPITVGLIESIPDVEAYSFSSLASESRIAGHRHYQPFVTAQLCLAGGEGAEITVGGESRSYTDGRWLVFDYTLVHSVSNAGSHERTVLLVLLPRRG
jgi:aspartyl/asparaginyl beta-hydroxylase (cupin superfamily)